MKIKNGLQAAWIGFVDGYQQPHYLTMGMTYDTDWLQSCYDHACNFGQWLGKKIGKDQEE